MSYNLTFPNLPNDPDLLSARQEVSSARTKRRKSSSGEAITTLYSSVRRVSSNEDKSPRTDSTSEKKISFFTFENPTSTKTKLLAKASRVSPLSHTKSNDNQSPSCSSSHENLYESPFSNTDWKAPEAFAALDPLNPHSHISVFQSTPERELLSSFTSPQISSSSSTQGFPRSTFPSSSSSLASSREDLAHEIPENMVSSFERINPETNSLLFEGHKNPSIFFENNPEHQGIDFFAQFTAFLPEAKELTTPQAFKHEKLPFQNKSLKASKRHSEGSKSCPESPERKDKAKNITQESIIELQSIAAEMESDVNQLINRAKTMSLRENRHSALQKRLNSTKP